jgi:hypothetical protein
MWQTDGFLTTDRHAIDFITFLDDSVLTSGTVKARVVVFNATFNNVSVISWQSVLLAYGTLFTSTWN